MGKLNSSSISISGGIGVVGVLCAVGAKCDEFGVAVWARSNSVSFIIMLGRRNVAISYAMFMPRITSYRYVRGKRRKGVNSLSTKSSDQSIVPVLGLVSVPAAPTQCNIVGAQTPIQT